MPQAARHNDVCRDGLAVAAHLAAIMALTLVLPAALRRRRDIRQVDVELIPPDETPFVVQLLSTGELRGVTADPPPADDPDPNATGQPRPEAPQMEAVADPAHREQEPELETIPTPREPDSPPDEPAPPPPAAETPSAPLPRRATRKRRAATQRAHPPQRPVPPPRPGPALHAEASEQAPAPAADATCEIRFWRGYVKANFYACVLDVHGEALAVAESPFFRTGRDGFPEQTDAAVAAYDALRQRLEQLGWEHAAAGRTWFGDVYSRPL